MDQDNISTPSAADLDRWASLLKRCLNHRRHGGTGFPPSMKQADRDFLKQAMDERWVTALADRRAQ